MKNITAFWAFLKYLMAHSSFQLNVNSGQTLKETISTKRGEGNNERKNAQLKGEACQKRSPESLFHSFHLLSAQSFTSLLYLDCQMHQWGKLSALQGSSVVFRSQR